MTTVVAEVSKADKDEWEAFWAEIDAFFKAISRYAAINVNAEDLREQGRRLVQLYFRVVQRDLTRLGMPREELLPIDRSMQALIKLTNGNNLKKSYLTALKQLRKARGDIEYKRELLLGAAERTSGALILSNVESRLLRMLGQLVPTAAASYQQALVDLQGSERSSYRGTADELREALREVLDHLAPDAEVMKQDGFALEKDRPKPTMRQKARFILKSRSVPSAARTTTEGSIERIEESAAVLARSVYERGSLVSHLTFTRKEVMSLKMYVDAVLGELLQIH